MMLLAGSGVRRGGECQGGECQGGECRAPAESRPWPAVAAWHQRCIGSRSRSRSAARLPPIVGPGARSGGIRASDHGRTGASMLHWCWSATSRLGDPGLGIHGRAGPSQALPCGRAVRLAPTPTIGIALDGRIVGHHPRPDHRDGARRWDRACGSRVDRWPVVGDHIQTDEGPDGTKERPLTGDSVGPGPQDDRRTRPIWASTVGVWSGTTPHRPATRHGRRPGTTGDPARPMTRHGR
jgi:hypothetical protein